MHQKEDKSLIHFDIKIRMMVIQMDGRACIVDHEVKSSQSDSELVPSECQCISSGHS
jgi:hypothetical protein